MKPIRFGIIGAGHIAMLCIAHHKAILCEKCFVLTEQEARTVFAAAKQEGLFVMEAMWSRFLPAIQKAKSWIQEGAIGDLELAHNIIGFKADEDPKGRILNPHLAGGAMYDIGVYAIELMTYLVDQEIQEIQSMVTRAHTDVDKVDNISIRFESCIANLQAAISIYCGTELKIYGTKGYIVIPNAHYASECMLYNQYEQVEHFVAPTTNGFRYQVQEVVDCLRNGQLESSIMPHDATIQCAAIFDQCLGT
ncbi:MAG: Gfo/Idh/MocA family oxidoreductase, partial [Niameybacter sp.]